MDGMVQKKISIDPTLKSLFMELKHYHRYLYCERFLYLEEVTGIIQVDFNVVTLHNGAIEFGISHDINNEKGRTLKIYDKIDKITKVVRGNSKYEENDIYIKLLNSDKELYVCCYEN